MGDDSPLFTFSQDAEVPKPPKEKWLLVKRGDWLRLRRQVERAGSETWSLESLGYAAISAGVTAAVAALTVVGGATWVYVVWWVLGAVGIVGGALSVYFGHLRRRDDKDRANDVLAEMDEIERASSTADAARGAE